MAQRPVGGPVGAPQQGSRFGGFGAGLMGGLLGVGLGGLLFGSGLFGGMSGIVGLLGFALQLALAFFLIRWLVRRFMGNRQPAMAGGAPNPNMFARTAQQPDNRMMGGGVARPAAAPVQIVEADYQAFDRLLNQVQAAWTARNLSGLRAMATPEMAGYFEEQLAAQNARGVRNEVTDVKLEQGDLSEAWREGSTEYATVAMRFSMIDVTRDAAGRVVEGDAANRTQATELWTFVRAAGRPWAATQPPRYAFPPSTPPPPGPAPLQRTRAAASCRPGPRPPGPRRPGCRGTPLAAPAAAAPRARTATG